MHVQCPTEKSSSPFFMSYGPSNYERRFSLFQWNLTVHCQSHCTVELLVQTLSYWPPHGKLLYLQAPWNHGASPLSLEFLLWSALFPWLALCWTAVVVPGACPYGQVTWPQVRIPGFPGEPCFSPKPSQCRLMREVEDLRFALLMGGSRLPAGRVAELDFALVRFSCLLVFIFLCDRNHPGFHCLPPYTISLLSLVFRQCHLFSFESLC